MNNRELNAVIFVLREWAKDEGVGLSKEALKKFHDLLIADLSKYRKVYARDTSNVQIAKSGGKDE